MEDVNLADEVDAMADNLTELVTNLNTITEQDSLWTVTCPRMSATTVSRRLSPNWKKRR